MDISKVTKCLKVLVFVVCVYFVGCSAEVNVTKGEMNVKQGNTDIPNVSGYFNFGNIPLNFSQSITFTIENFGISDLNLTGNPKVEIKGQNASDFSAITNLTASIIEADSETTFKIHFKPLSLGTKSATVSIANDDRQKNPYTFVIVGTCTSPGAEIHIKQNETDILCASGSFDFSMVSVGSTSVKVEFTIFNNGNQNLVLNSGSDKISKSGTNPEMFEIDEEDLLTTIKSSNSSAFYITFKPTSAGIKTAQISILNNDSDENPYTFTITGTGVNVPEINVKQGSDDILHSTGIFDFGGVLINDSSPETTFTIENLGYSTLELNGSPKIEISGTDSSLFSINQSSTEVNVGVGSSTTFSITFSPTTTGEKNATISIKNNDDDENPYVFTIKGTGVVPEINVKQSIKNITCGSGVFDFYRCLIGASSVEIEFIIENIGSADVELKGSPIVDISGTNASEFNLNTNSTQATITPGSSTTFTVTFDPAGLGSKIATITIENNDDDENPYTFTIKGEGTYDNAMGWIGGGQDGWQTGTAPLATRDPRGFHRPKSVFVDYKGYIYIADGNNNRICKWDSAGNSMGWIGHNYDGWQTTECPSTSGTSFKRFDSPSSVFVDSAGYIYVADYGNHRICKWNSSGVAIGWIGGGSNGWKTTTAPSTYGTDYQSFWNPMCVFVDTSGSIFVAEGKNNRICKWDISGSAIGWIGGGSNGWKTGTAPSNSSDYQSFIGPRMIYIDKSSNIYIADSGNNRVSKWDTSGIAIGWIGGGSNGWKTSAAPSSGSDYQSFDSPWGIFLDSSGFIYIADNANNRVCKWNNNGNAIGWIGGGSSSSGWKTYDASSVNGSDFESFDTPRDLWGNSQGVLYIADTTNNRISKWQN